VITPAIPSRPTLRLETLAAQLGSCGRRVVEEALTAALPAFWERRAEQLDDARPRPTDFHGRASSAELAERDRRLAEQAAACREHAELLRMFPEEEAVVELVADVWDEVRAA
jgi:hypothetical protein